MTENRPQILIVDDEPLNINILVAVLAGEWRTLVATSGAQALRRCQATPPPDLILLDVMMPEMDGYEVCRRLASDPATSGIPVIFVTAMAESDQEMKGFELGAVDYITKPISPEIVCARVRAHVDLAMARRTLRDKNIQLQEAMQRAADMENMMRHDLKGSLSVVLGMSLLLLDEDSLNDATRRALEKIESAGSRIGDLIDLSLDLVKMERGVYELTPVDIDVVEVLDQVLADVETLRRVKDIEVEIYAGEAPARTDMIYAYGEKILLRSALLNLLKNAIEASPEHETVAIEIKAGSSIEICLRNKGVVPVDVRSRFFEKYATSGKRDGTGLGTYSARMLVETMAGSISLDSSNPNSTAVVVTMPVR